MKKLLFSLLSLLMVCGLAWTGSSALAATAADGETVSLAIYPQQLNESGTADNLYSVQVTCLKKGATESEAVTKTTASAGDPHAVFDGCVPTDTYVVTLHKEGYKDTVVETLAGEERHGSMVGLDLYIVMKKAESAPVANGVKVSGKVTATGWGGMFSDSYAELLNSEGALVAKKALEMNSNLRCYTYEFTEVQSGSYGLSITALTSNGRCFKKTETVVVTSDDVEKDIVLEEYAGIVTMYVMPQYLSDGIPTTLYGVTGVLTKQGTSESVTKTTGTEGDPRLGFQCDTNGRYSVTLSKDGYKDTTIQNIKVWEENHGSVNGVTLNIVMQEEAPIVESDEVTLVGEVSLGSHTDITLNEKLQLVCKTEDGTTKTLTSAIENGKYAFAGVPKNAYDSLLVVTTVYGSYGSVSYEASSLLQVKTPANGVLDLLTATPVNDTITQNIELERIGFSVKGSVKNAVNGSGLAGVTVKLGDDLTVQTAENGYGTSEGDFTFNVVTATQLSFEFSKSGFTTVTKDTTISMAAVDVDGVVVLDPVAMTPQAQEYTLTGKAGIRPSTPLKDVVVELWASQFIENQGYVKGDKLGVDTTDAEGAWSLKYTGFADDMVYLIARHANIETEEMQRQVSYLLNQTSIDIYGSPILYGMVNCQATQDAEAATPTVNLTWEWPQALRNGYVNENGEGTYEITMVSIFRTVHRADEDYMVKVCDTITVANTLPLTSFVDAGVQYPLSVDSTYTYSFSVQYSGKPDYKTVEVKDSANLTVKIAAKPVDPVKESFELTLQVNDTTMGKVEGAGKYEEGTRVTIKAIAKEGYVFEAWKTKDGAAEISKATEYSFVLSSDSTLKAFFAAKPVDPVKDSFELTLNCDAAMGKVEGAGKYEKGTEVTIKATANEGYVFVAWVSGNDTVAKTAEHKLTLVSDSILTAVFVKDEKPVDPTANEDREQAAWNVYTEGQTMVLRSTAACQYDVYNLAGALVKRAKTNANEYRIAVNNSGLYIIRRISATGTSVKKVMVR